MNARSSHSEHAASYQQQLPVHLLHTKNAEGEDCFFVVRASQTRFNQMLAKKNRDSINIAEFGEILISGYGRTPSASARAKLKTRHGVELPEDN